MKSCRFSRRFRLEKCNAFTKCCTAKFSSAMKSRKNKDIGKSISAILKKIRRNSRKNHVYCRGVTYESVFPLVDKDYHGKPYFNIYDCDGNPIF